MSAALSQIQDVVFKAFNASISEIKTDLECADYSGYNFNINDSKIKFRKAKITPTKDGQFVTLWNRNASGKTEPFNITHDFDFYIIAAEQHKNNGFFIFPKQVLAQHKILTVGDQPGKRGFRVYTNWDRPKNKQAEKSKGWQTQYFVDFTIQDKTEWTKLQTILQLR